MYRPTTQVQHPHAAITAVGVSPALAILPDEDGVMREITFLVTVSLMGADDEEQQLFLTASPDTAGALAAGLDASAHAMRENRDGHSAAQVYEQYYSEYYPRVLETLRTNTHPQY